MRFLSTLGRLPNTWIALFVIVLAGLTEGLGLALFVPLVEIMTGGDIAGLPRPFSDINTALETVGIPVSLLSLLVIAAAIILGSLGLAYYQRHLVIVSRQAYTMRLRNRLVRAHFGADWGFLALRSHGEFVNQLNTESSRAGICLMDEVFGVAKAIQILILLALSSVLSWELTAITLVYGGVVVLAVWPLQRKAKILGEETSQANKALNFHAVDFLRGLKLIKITAAESQVAAQMSDQIRSLYGVLKKSELNVAQNYFIVQALPVVLLALLIGVSYEILNLGASFTLVFLLVLSRIAPFMGHFQQNYQAYSLRSPSFRIVDAIIKESEHATEDERRTGEEVDLDRGGIRFEAVGFRFDGEKSAVLNGLDLEVGPREMVALVGESGSGKSTIIDLIAGLRFPTAGRITAGGIDLRNANIHAWRKQIGYVPQEITIFNDTVRNNLLFAKPTATDDEIRNCLRLAYLEEVVDALPHGLNTMLGEGGARLSGGQKQRLALARALIGSPAILLLDEATSALDTESERIVQKAIESLASRLAIIVVAHRLSTVRHADKVVVLSEGRIIETGSFDALLKTNGSLARLHELELD